MNNQPAAKIYFTAQWGGTQIGFTEIKGLEMEYEVIEFRESASPEYANRKMPGAVIFSDITLTRFVKKGDDEFIKWFDTGNLDKIERRDVIISLLNETHEPIFIWKLKNCFPRKYIGPELNVLGGEPAKESLVLTHEGMSVVLP